MWWMIQTIIENSLFNFFWNAIRMWSLWTRQPINQALGTIGLIYYVGFRKTAVWSNRWSYKPCSHCLILGLTVANWVFFVRYCLWWSFPSFFLVHKIWVESYFINPDRGGWPPTYFWWIVKWIPSLNKRKLVSFHWRCQRKINTWRNEYNEFRPHSSLGDLTPMEFLEQVKNAWIFYISPVQIMGDPQNFDLQL